ncbi:ATP-binding protein [Corynebacterium lowii]|uniref:Divergent AAA domain protein n=1 Tax=Corynebacterium lowii TaxID=1544413 RepID=A0A0Q0YHU1_9CORY|nr:ATP-binding protein [Corynebacterium lowii]KQB86206.1 Divergent AAA domain protein [Corynebacterium lowii]MDP9852680.1 ATP-dependent DNA helicase RecG [Corynebacterium lowii]
MEHLPVHEVLTRPEDQWFDRKSFQTKPKDLAKAFVGFANAEGGVIAWGVRDREAQGLPTTAQDNALRQAALELTDPTVEVRWEILKTTTPSGEPAQIFLLSVTPGPRVHYLTNGECWLRAGDETRQLKNFEDIQELAYSKGERTHDSTGVPRTDMADLSHTALENYANTIGSRSPEDALKARHLLTHKGDATVGAILMFGNDPQGFFPHATVRVLKWREKNRGAGRNQLLEADRHFEGPLPTQVEEARQYILSLLPHASRLGESGKFIHEPVVPTDAWLEGLVNAVIHRSYSLTGDHIRFEIFPDRIEITNPGRFPGLADPRRPESISRFARNPTIARVASELRIGQELGEGIRRIFSEMRAVGFSDPAYTQTNGTVTLTLNTTHRISEQQLAFLPTGAATVLAAMQRIGSPLSTGDIAELVKMSRPSARNALNALRDAELVEWHGQSPRDPRATWRLRDAL